MGCENIISFREGSVQSVWRGRKLGGKFSV